VDGSSSPCSRMIRSTVSASTRLVTWSQDTRVPVRVRPSTVMMRTFSGEMVLVWYTSWPVCPRLTVYVVVERHVCVCCGGRLKPRRWCAWPGRRRF
jgi:hypothetical protein